MSFLFSSSFLVQSHLSQFCMQKIRAENSFFLDTTYHSVVRGRAKKRRKEKPNVDNKRIHLVGVFAIISPKAMLQRF